MASRISAFLLGLLAVAVLALSACSHESNAKSTVPKLSTSKPSTTTNSDKPSDSKGTRLRLDMNGKDKQRVIGQYLECFKKHGWDKENSRRTNGATGSKKEIQRNASKACRSKAPLPPWELDANNPKSEKFVHEVVKCMRKKGDKDVGSGRIESGRRQVDMGFDDGPNDQKSVNKKMKDNAVCKKKVADKGIGR